MSVRIAMAVRALGLSLFIVPPCSAQGDIFRLQETQLTIPQVDYEDAVYYDEGDQLPHIDFGKVRWDVTVEKTHTAIIIENEYQVLSLLPEMGRVYSMVYKPTGHETLWRNDIVRPGGANNDTGWWLWIGGVEYTLPGDEHGTTWALPWSYDVREDSQLRKSVRMQIVEPTTGLHERIDINVYPGLASFEADIRIWNVTADTISFAHWVNPMWAPGGQNELTDNTEFIIPTERILIEERWQANMGPSPQIWKGNPLRFIRNWGKMGDLRAGGLTAGFYSAYSHDAEEGVVRVFDPLKTPGMDMWTYGYHPTDIPMGSGGPNNGYAEMWGGTVEHFPDEVRPLAPGASLTWTEWMYPYQGTAGLTFANRELAANCSISDEGDSLFVALCPVRRLTSAALEVRSASRTIHYETFSASPEAPHSKRLAMSPGTSPEEVLVLVLEGTRELARFRP